MYDTEVLIIGAGVVGLSTALFLQRAGVSPLVVERHAGTSIHPRARGVNLRTMELYRAIGLEEDVREAGRATPIALGLLQGATLAEAADAPVGRWVRRWMNRIASRPRLRISGSPTLPCRVTQDHLEPALARRAVERGASLRFSTEVVGLVQDERGVTATLRSRVDGVETSVRARFVVAADGARSPTRARLGIGTTGRGSLGHLLNILFEADLSDWIPGRDFSIAVIHQPGLAGLFAAIDGRSRWVFHLRYDPTVEPAEAFTPERLEATVRQALGLDRALRILRVLPWECAARVADHYRVGRIFLAGDAAHLMPPWGGQGANTGIADGWDLAWKLGLVLREEAPDTLLDTYEAERRPIGLAAAEASADRADETGLMRLPRLGDLLRGISLRRWIWPAVPAEPSALQRLSGLGYTLASAAISPEVGAARRWALDGRPGTRLPHAEVIRQGQPCSSLDLVGARPVLISASARWWRAAEGVHVVRLGQDVTEDGRLRALARIGGEGALLVRPDGLVAWRARGAGEAEGLRRAIQAMLSGVS